MIRENPKFGAECFLKQLGQIDEDYQLAYALILEGLYGDFAVSGETYYMEYNYKLFRWKQGDSEWHDTGIQEIGELTHDNMSCSFKLAASDGIVYIGKRDGQLFRSFDGGDSWNDVTSVLPLSVERFIQIIFAGSTIYVATDKGVLSSIDGTTWNVLVDKARESVIIKSLVTENGSVYGANDEGIYCLDQQTGTWEQIVPEIQMLLPLALLMEIPFTLALSIRGYFGLQ